jgi:hypothetical protein
MSRRWEEGTQEAAFRRFLGRASELMTQARWNPGLIDLCDELAAAETALAKTGSLPPEFQTVRRDECRGLIDRLAREIDEALAKAKVVPVSPRPRGPSP